MESFKSVEDSKDTNNHDDGYFERKEMLFPTEEEKGFDLEYLKSHPSEIFIKSSEITPEQIREQHRSVMRRIASPDYYVGMGNDGFVFGLKNRDDDSSHCIKMVWKDLDVVFGKGVKKDEIEDNFGPEISNLYKIKEAFAKIRAKTREILSKGNLDKIPTNGPEMESAIQEISRRLIKRESVNCTIPRIVSIRKEQEEEPMIGDYSYELRQDYSAISMEQVKGASIEDFILNYPENKEYLNNLDVDRFKEDLITAVKILNEGGIRHQDFTLRNVMFDFKLNRPAIIDFGKSSMGVYHLDESKELEMVEQVVKRLKSFSLNPERESQKLKDSLEV